MQAIYFSKKWRCEVELSIMTGALNILRTVEIRVAYSSLSFKSNDFYVSIANLSVKIRHWDVFGTNIAYLYIQ